MMYHYVALVCKMQRNQKCIAKKDETKCDLSGSDHNEDELYRSTHHAGLEPVEVLYDSPIKPP